MDLTLKLSEITIFEFISVIAALVFTIFMVWFLLQMIYLLLDVLFFVFCKNKYRTRRRELLYIYALKDMAKHRKQVRNAPTEKAFYLYYNRMIGAYESYVALGIFKDNVCSKLLDIRGVYVWKKRSNENESAQEHTKINPNN